ncbi:hypothetical protein MBLNU13_g10496t1 [Cladosporium sp. NU13]
MADGASSPLFMPEGTPEGNTPPPKHGGGSGNGIGNGNGSGNGIIKSEQGTPEAQTNLQVAPRPGANTEPEVKDEQPPSPPRQFNAFYTRGRPTASPRPLAPLTSRAERRRRKAASESATPDHASANTTLESAGRYTQTAARDSAVHNNTSASNTLRGDASTQPSTQAIAAPRGPNSAPPAPQIVDTGVLIGNAHRHLNALAADLRKQQNDACEREEHLATLLEHAREIRSRVIQDRSNGLVIIRDRKKKLEDLEKRRLNNETIDPAELIGLVDPLKLEEPVERGEFERMKVEGRGEEHGDGYESDPLGFL